jgi:hypothetical protein
MDKDRGRGSSAMKGAIDAEYKVQLDQASKLIKLEAKKMKEAEMPMALTFSLTQVDLPITDKHGDAVKGAFLTTVDISGIVKEVNDKATFLGKNQKKVLDSLLGLEEANARAVIAGDFAVPIDNDTWRESAHEAGVPRNRFSEARDALASKGLIFESSNGVFASVRKSNSVTGA